MDALVRQVLACRRAPGAARVYPPGHLEAETARRYADEGIPLTDATLADLERTAREVGCDAGALGVAAPGHRSMTGPHLEGPRTKP
jgi:LDH2 family malate/lactate/ureidoglycolate dehydrogenase